MGLFTNELTDTCHCSHTPHGRGYEDWMGYYQHANDYWTKGMGPITSPRATGEVDVCANKFTDFSRENETHRGGIEDAAALESTCRTSTEPDPPCYVEHIFREQTLRMIHRHNVSEAMFHMHAFHLLHTPLEVPLAYLDKIDAVVKAKGGKPFDDKTRRLYHAMVLYLDDAVSMMVAALKDKGMWEDTLVVFSSDNGGPLYIPSGANNHPLKGGKFSDFEGGIRTNAFLSGGYLPPGIRGTRHNGIVSIADW